MRTLHLWPLAVLAMVACAETGDVEPEEEMTTDSVALAEASFDPAAFDTVTWESEEEVIERGGVVFSYSCSKCHGPRGFGDGGFVSGGDTLRPPSFHQASWEFADDPEGLRRMIYTGGENGMPHWGLEGLKVRDVDAVATYITEGLRGG